MRGEAAASEQALSPEVNSRSCAWWKDDKHNTDEKLTCSATKSPPAGNEPQARNRGAGLVKWIGRESRSQRQVSCVDTPLPLVPEKQWRSPLSALSLPRTSTSDLSEPRREDPTKRKERAG